jgi:hypothetical protein
MHQEILAILPFHSYNLSLQVSTLEGDFQIYIHFDMNGENTFNIDICWNNFTTW